MNDPFSQFGSTAPATSEIPIRENGGVSIGAMLRQQQQQQQQQQQNMPSPPTNISSSPFPLPSPTGAMGGINTVARSPPAQQSSSLDQIPIMVIRVVHFISVRQTNFLVFHSPVFNNILFPFTITL